MQLPAIVLYRFGKNSGATAYEEFTSNKTVELAHIHSPSIMLFRDLEKQPGGKRVTGRVTTDGKMYLQITALFFSYPVGILSLE